MSSTTDQRIAIEEAVYQLLEDDGEQEARDFLDQVIENWREDQTEEEA